MWVGRQGTRMFQCAVAEVGSVWGVYSLMVFGCVLVLSGLVLEVGHRYGEAALGVAEVSSGVGGDKRRQGGMRGGKNLRRKKEVCLLTYTHLLTHTHIKTRSLSHARALSLSPSHTHTHTYIYTHAHTYKHAHTYNHTNARARTHTHTHTLTHALTHTHVHTYAHTHTHTHTHV